VLGGGLDMNYRNSARNQAPTGLESFHNPFSAGGAGASTGNNLLLGLHQGQAGLPQAHVASSARPCGLSVTQAGGGYNGVSQDCRPVAKSTSIISNTAGMLGASSSLGPGATAMSVVATPSHSNHSGGTPTVITSLPSDDTTSQVSSIVSPLNKRRTKKTAATRRPRSSPSSSLSPPLSPGSLAARAAAGESPTGVSDAATAATRAAPAVVASSQAKVGALRRAAGNRRNQYTTGAQIQQAQHTQLEFGGLYQQQGQSSAHRLADGAGGNGGPAWASGSKQGIAPTLTRSKTGRPPTRLSVGGDSAAPAAPLAMTSADRAVVVSLGPDATARLTHPRSLHELQLEEMRHQSTMPRVAGSRGMHPAPNVIEMASSLHYQPSPAGNEVPLNSVLGSSFVPGRSNPGTADELAAILRGPSNGPATVANSRPSSAPSRPNASTLRDGGSGDESAKTGAASLGSAPLVDDAANKPRRRRSSTGSGVTKAKTGAQRAIRQSKSSAGGRSVGASGSTAGKMQTGTCDVAGISESDLRNVQVAQPVTAQEAVLANAEQQARLRAMPNPSAMPHACLATDPDEPMPFVFDGQGADFSPWAGATLPPSFQASLPQQTQMQNTRLQLLNDGQTFANVQPFNASGEQPDRQDGPTRNVNPSQPRVDRDFSTPTLGHDYSRLPVEPVLEPAKDPWSHLGFEMDGGGVSVEDDPDAAAEVVRVVGTGDGQVGRGLVEGDVMVDDILEFDDIARGTLNRSDLDWR
jgi:hypothetical protein